MRLVNPRERFNPFFFPCAGKKKALRGKRKGRPRGISNFPLGNPLKATKKGACAPPLLDFSPGRMVELPLIICRGGCLHPPGGKTCSSGEYVIRCHSYRSQFTHVIPRQRLSLGALSHTGGAVVRHGRKISVRWPQCSTLVLTVMLRQTAPRIPSASFLPILFWQDRKEWAAGGNARCQS